MELRDFVILMAVLLTQGCGGEPTTPADLVLRSGKVVTVAESIGTVEALAIRGSSIVAVGSDQEIDSHIGPETRVVDLGGRLAIPGFIEGHGHFLGLGSAKTILDLNHAASWEEIVAMVGEAAEKAQPGEWIRGRGWHQEKWDTTPEKLVEGNPVHDSLSAASPDNPVLLGHASGHAAFANAKAMELAGLDAATADPAGGELVRDAEGNLTGLLRETAQRVVGAAYSRSRDGMTAEDLEIEARLFVELAGQEALSKGVTSFHDAGTPFDAIDLFKKMEAEGSRGDQRPAQAHSSHSSFSSASSRRVFSKARASSDRCWCFRAFFGEARSAASCFSRASQAMMRSSSGSRRCRSRGRSR